jgi:hypothetical protein
MQVLRNLCGLATARLANHDSGGVRLNQVQQLCAVRIDWQAPALVRDSQSLILIENRSHSWAGSVAVDIEGQAKLARCLLAWP